MPHLIQCCVNNENGNLPERVVDTGIRVQEDICLQRCGVCYDAPFAVVDGDLVEANSQTDLLTQVRTEVEK